MRRVKVIYEDGISTYGMLDVEGQAPSILIGGSAYSLDAFATSNAMVAVNDEQSLLILHRHGIKARPTGRQTKATIALSESLKARIITAAKQRGSSMTLIIIEAVQEWLDAHGL